MPTMTKAARWKAKQREKGLCIKCTQPVTTYACYCDFHAQENRDRMRKWLDARRSKKQLERLTAQRAARAVSINN